jgi:hypothetical protein
MKGILICVSPLRPEYYFSVLPSERKESIRPVLVDKTVIPQNGDAVYVFSDLARGLWTYHEPPCPMPHWGNPKLCWKVIANSDLFDSTTLRKIAQGDIVEGDEVELSN